MPRILLTTRCRDSGLYDYFRENAPRNCRWRFGMPRTISFGLRFLRQNLSDLEILEYPTRAEFSAQLKRGWDAVGFSFYLEETNDILGMAAEARQAGVRELWAGNYGALTPSVQSHFDHVFTSYSEEAVAGRLGARLDEIHHPPLITRFSLPGGWSFPVGVLFSSRGCSFRCTFCQTTAFAPKPKAISLPSLDRVLRFYVQHGIHFVLLLDENFGNLPSHAEAVIELLARHRVRWLVQSRVDLFLRNFDDWQKCGMEGALFGIESFHQDILKQMRKNEKVGAAFELAARLNRANLYAQGYYIIGLPTETPQSIAEDLRTLRSLQLDVTQITIVTPHPETEMWRELGSRYGIFEKDWSRFDTKHLVWNHPHCAPGVLESLLEEGFRGCYGRDWLLRTMKKCFAMRREQRDFSSILFGPVRSRLASPRRLPYLPASGSSGPQRVDSAVA
ncbi:MAG TPA: radical SAM protein [Candidatus Acidoferrales bacterium]|nr:radical SAM protein [Candidatus Acidoferrales bacterium]